MESGCSVHKLLNRLARRRRRDSRSPTTTFEVSCLLEIRHPPSLVRTSWQASRGHRRRQRTGMTAPVGREQGARCISDDMAHQAEGDGGCSLQERQQITVSQFSSGITHPLTVCNDLPPICTCLIDGSLRFPMLVTSCASVSNNPTLTLISIRLSALVTRCAGPQGHDLAPVGRLNGYLDSPHSIQSPLHLQFGVEAQAVSKPQKFKPFNSPDSPVFKSTLSNYHSIRYRRRSLAFFIPFLDSQRNPVNKDGRIVSGPDSYQFSRLFMHTHTPIWCRRQERGSIVRGPSVQKVIYS